MLGIWGLRGDSSRCLARVAGHMTRNPEPVSYIYKALRANFRAKIGDFVFLPQTLSIALRRAPVQIRLCRLVAPPFASSVPPGMRADGGSARRAQAAAGGPPRQGPSNSATDGLQSCSTRPQTRQIPALWPACAAALDARAALGRAYGGAVALRAAPMALPTLRRAWA